VPTLCAYIVLQSVCLHSVTQCIPTFTECVPALCAYIVLQSVCLQVLLLPSVCLHDVPTVRA